MQIFNTYPVRFPILQPSLGEALAKAPSNAIEPYIKALHLYVKRAGSDPGRRCVADCLRAFRKHADRDRRKALWTAAHDRWLEWNFAEADPNQHVLWASSCDLDYALVGYAIECMDEAARVSVIQAIGKELQTLDRLWHGTPNQASPYRTGCGSFTCRPTHRSCNPPNTSGRSSTNLWSTSTLKPSATWMHSWPNAAASSIRIASSSPHRQTSTGGQNRSPGIDHPNPV